MTPWPDLNPNVASACFGRSTPRPLTSQIWGGIAKSIRDPCPCRRIRKLRSLPELRRRRRRPASQGIMFGGASSTPEATLPLKGSVRMSSTKLSPIPPPFTTGFTVERPRASTAEARSDEIVTSPGRG